MSLVTVTVPASTANLGPGFDCLSLALARYNELELEVGGDGVQVEIEGEGADQLQCDGSNLFVQAVFSLFEELRIPPPGLRIHAVSRIPVGLGLGSSAAAIVAGLAAANAVLGGRLPRERLLALAYRLEGHADNVAAALYGGLNMVGTGPEGVLSRQVPLPDLRVALAVPVLDVPTKTMRKVLPKEVPLHDAVYNLGRTALTVEALRQGDYDLLSWSMKDRLHQPYRKALIPGYDVAMQAARDAGAAAVVLSGAGPSLVAFSPSNHEAIAQAMAEAFRAEGMQASTLVLPVDRGGVQTRPKGVH